MACQALLRKDDRVHVTDDFVFLRPPKTGGSFVAEVLQEVFGPSCAIGAKHATRRDVPEEHSRKPVVTLVREPIAYYTSVYRYGWWIDRDTEGWNWTRWHEAPLRDRFPEYPYLTFRHFVEALLDIPNRYVPDEVKALATRMPVGQLLLSTLDYACVDPLPVLRAGLEEARVASIRSMIDGVVFLHTETLATDLEAFLVGRGIDAAAASQACRRPPVRPVNTPHGRVLGGGHGQPYDPGDRSHLEADVVAEIMRAESLYLDILPEYR